ncbi:MAG: RCC1-like domain-containing protein [Candidatus Dormibacteria bacterium]
MPSDLGPRLDRTVIAIAAGYDHILALTSSGTVYAWGYNHDG